MYDDGLSSDRRYRERHKAEIAERNRKYYREHRAEVLARKWKRYNEQQLPETFALAVYKPVCHTCGKAIPASSPYRGYCSRECERARWMTHPGRAYHA